MVAPVMLLAAEVAELLDIQVESWRSYVSRGLAPEPDEHIGATPRWRKSTITEWDKARPGRGAGGGRPRLDGLPPGSVKAKAPEPRPRAVMEEQPEAEFATPSHVVEDGGIVFPVKATKAPAKAKRTVKRGTAL